jgi:hypothetical protein
MDNCLTISNIWSDEMIIELKIRACNPSVTSVVQIYVGESDIDELIASLTDFYLHQKTFEWTVSDKTDLTTNYFYLKPYIYNTKKHVALEIEMINKDRFGHLTKMHIGTELESINELVHELKKMQQNKSHEVKGIWYKEPEYS